MKRKVGRPRKPINQLTNWALWKRAQRADSKPKNKGMVRHHPDHNYGRTSSKVIYISRALHNRIHGKRRNGRSKQRSTRGS